MKQFLYTFLFLLATAHTFGQNITQTIRGTVIDSDSKESLIGATVIVTGSSPAVGAATDIKGDFRIENVAIGRTSLTISYIGYETKTIPNIEVSSAKEVILNISLQESVSTLDEISVKASKKGSEAINDMSIISSRSVSVEQSKRYAGSFSDPSRILSNFAGVANTPDGSNDIIVRGNSPKYVQWRLEGVEITNPNHFEDQNSTSGGLSALNNNLLAKSDFHTGAFTAEFGDALSGVYDVRLRSGNNEKFEGIFGLGIMGTDITLEGPFKKGYAGSYLFNYRYSTVGLIQDLGLVNVDGVFTFQDMAGKVVLPTNKAGTFSLFLLAGKNTFLKSDLKQNMWKTPGDRSMLADITETLDKDNHLLNSGITHRLSLGKSGFLKTTLSYSNVQLDDRVYESKITQTEIDGETINDTIGKTLNYNGLAQKHVYRGAMTYSKKINTRNKIQSGTKFSVYDYTNKQSVLAPNLEDRITLADFNGTINTFRNFVSWKHRFNNQGTIIAGLHNMNVLTNNKSTIEPRLAMNWKFNNGSSVHAGYGNHSTMERIHNYYTKVRAEDGTEYQPNKDLDLLKAHHFVAGFKKHCNKNISAQVELYYQHLYNLPVENNENSHYSTVNEGMDYTFVDLVNEGTGKNYGIELTIERYFSNNYYFLINGSLYESKYTALDGIERNTQYNGNYLANVLAGKEFDNLGKNRNNTLAINAKLFFGGGKKIIPLLRDENGNVKVDPETNQYWDYSRAYEKDLGDVYQGTISFSYKINRLKTTHEIFLDLNNITGQRANIKEYYDESQPNNIGYMKQAQFFPNFMYRIYF